MSDTSSSRRPDLTLPLLLGLAALLGSQSFQMVQLAHERAAMKTVYESQKNDVTAGDQVRKQLDALLSGATRLAQQGNMDAASLLGELVKQGITYQSGTR